MVRKMLSGPAHGEALWDTVPCWHSMWVPVEVLAVPPLIQLMANTPGKAAKDCASAGAL